MKLINIHNFVAVILAIGLYMYYVDSAEYLQAVIKGTKQPVLFTYM